MFLHFIPQSIISVWLFQLVKAHMGVKQSLATNNTGWVAMPELAILLTKMQGWHPHHDDNG